MLLAASLLLLITGIAHSYLGERYILVRLFRRDNLPKVLGSTAFTTGTLRFVWHLTTVAWGALAYLVFSAGSGAISNDQLLGVIGTASLVSAAFPLYFTRGKHLSWIVFIVVGVLLLWSRSASAAQAAPAPYTFIEGKVPADMQPDGNSVVLEGPDELLVIDTGRHPEHTDKILAVAKARNKPITAIVNTHWHLDHATGNARIRAAYPGAKLYASTAVEGALKGFLVRNVDQAKARLEDPAVSELGKTDTRLYLNAINDPGNLIPDRPVTGPATVKLGGRELQLHLARYAATEGDVWVHDPANKTVFVGDLVVAPLPFFDTGCAQGWRKALADIDRLEFQTLVPGHGLPMDHAAFSTYRRAFDAFTACAEGSEPTATCVATWMRQGAPFVAMHPDPKYTEAALGYYVDRILRVPAKREELCGKTGG